jgi:integrase
MSTTAAKKEYLLLPLFEKFIADNKNGKRLQSNGKRVSEGTIENYVCVYKLLVKYSTTQKNALRFLPVNKLTHRQLITEKNYWAKFYKNFTGYLYNNCKHYDNYVGFVVKIIKVLFNYISKKLLLPIGNFHEQFYVRKEQVPIITLLPEQLNFLIYDTGFEQQLNKRMQQVKDTFVFGCTVALRFSDLMLLKQSNLRIVNDVWYLLARSKKTSAESQIQLPDYAIAIIKKYKKQKGGFLLPRFNNVNLNKFVKRLTEQAGFTQPMSKKRERQGVVKDIGLQSEAMLLKQQQLRAEAIATQTDVAPVENTTTAATTKKTTAKKQIRFCDLVTTHTMRRTAITTMLCLGMPEHLVRKISGHSPMSKEFFRYVALAQVYQDKETTVMFDKLKEKTLTTH